MTLSYLYMSESRVRRSCQTFKISRSAVERKQLDRQPFIIADSKGEYIQEAITTEGLLNIRYITKRGWVVQQVIDWVEKNLKNQCESYKKKTFYIWLGTCDLTELNRTTGYISLRHQLDANVRYLRRKFIELKTYILENINQSKVIFLEVPPYSIQRWNKYKGHKQPETFADDEQTLQDQLYQLNRYIREINESEKKSPKFEYDIRKISKRKGGVDEYYNFNLYKKDGVHPNPQLSKLWLRRISTKILEYCYKDRIASTVQSGSHFRSLQFSASRAR